jgi:diguanylate cyclase (GGDEF)-like protein/PAS domain S-box-containing protein
MGNWLTVRCLCLLVLLASATQASERRYYFDDVDSEHGLASHSVTALYQGRQGFLWIATQSGLHKYDGYRYQRYQHSADDPASLPDSYVTALAEDAQGHLWVGSTAQGLAALDPASGKVVSTALVGGTQNSPRDAIGALAFDPGRGLWIGTSAGIDLLDPESGNRREIYRLPDSDSDSQVFGLALAADGTLWSATSSGLLRIAAHTDTAQVVAGHDLPLALCVALGSDGAIYAGANSGLYRVDRQRDSARQLWPADSRAGAAQVRAIVQDRRGRLWLAVFGVGLVIYDPADGSTQTLHHDPAMPGSLPDDYATRLLIDRSGLLWVGGDIAGVVTTEPEGAQFRYVMDPSPQRNQMSNNIRAIGEDSAGRLWLGTDGDGLKRYDPARDAFEYFDDVFKLVPSPQELNPQWHIWSLGSAGGDKLWVSSNHGVYLFDPATRKVSALPVDRKMGNGLPSELVRSILVARDSSVWFGTYGEGLVHWQPATATRAATWEVMRHDPHQPDSLAHNLIDALFQDDGGRIWIGTIDGLSVYDPAQGRMRSFRHDPADARSLADNVVRALYQSGDGTLWIGTQSSLDRVNGTGAEKPVFEHYFTRNGLPGATVFGILEDAHHNIWVSTNYGIATYNRTIGSFLSFALRDGLQSVEFNPGASFRRSNGELIFGGLRGINLFRPDVVHHDTYLPPIVITGISIGGTPNASTPAADGVVMEQSQRIARFEFAALDYAAPRRNRFTYRLRGFDPDWIDAGMRHTATYTNLPAGDYVFEVRGANADGVWNQDGTSVPLRVIPSWWVSDLVKAFYAAFAIALAALLWNNYRRRRRRELRYHRELREREDRLRLALWGSGDEFWDWDIGAGVIHRIGTDQLLGGQSEQTLPVDKWREEAVHPDDLPAYEQNFYDHIEGRRDFFESVHRLRNVAGDWIWVLARGKVVERDADGKALRVCGTARDVTEARLAERERRIASEVIDSMSEAVSVTDLEFCFVAVNRAFTRMFGYQESEVAGEPVTLLYSSQHPVKHYVAMREAFLSSGHWHGELWQKRKNGEEFLSWIEISEVRDASGRRTHYVTVTNDITERKRAEQELRYLANYDTLTGLPNRALLGERLAHAVIRARRTGRKVAVLFLDMDRFKHVNDSMGHAIGDRVLKAVGERLRSSVREGATVARLGGDEFTVVLEDILHADEPEQVAAELIEVFSDPLELESGQQVVISPSIGISLYPDHAQVPTDLVKYADTAMYQAKEAGRNMYMLYTPAMDSVARQRAGMLGALRLALERNEISLVYQPMLDLDSGRITGVEALARWHNEEYGDVPPGVFIPLAEEAGLIERIGEFVLYRACAQLVEWEENGLPGITMSVNLSALQLLRDELTQRLCEVLAELKLSPQQLELELTESVLMANPDLAIHTLDRLHTLGVSIAIDDFGTGYSSLSYLKRLPIDTLKIDRSFVGDITTDPDDEAITKTIITMAHSLGLDVIAEGVETLEQLEYLHEHDCDAIQGHWLSVPLAPAACLTFIREYERNRAPTRSKRTVR